MKTTMATPETTLTAPTQPQQSAALPDVAATSLLTLYCRAAESQTADPILGDPQAVAITRRLTPLLSKSDDKLARALVQGKINRTLQVHIALRARRYDQYAREFLQAHPGGMLVNIGCGMDTRYFRLGEPEIPFYDLDLPELIAFKRQFVTETKHYQLLPHSVFDYAWMDRVLAEAGPRPAMFLAEGVFMYLEPEKVHDLVLTLRDRFPGSELVCEVVNQRWINPSFKPMVKRKMQGSARLGADAEFQFGVKDSDDFEKWGADIKLLDEWSYFASGHPKLGWVSIFKRFKLFTKTQYTVHYCLGRVPEA